MPSQITVRLPEELSRALERAARRMRRSASDIVRTALLNFLLPYGPDARRPAQRVQSLLGSLESGVPDLAENHRKYVLESLRNAR